jgi:hypothetical protein
MKIGIEIIKKQIKGNEMKNYKNNMKMNIEINNEKIRIEYWNKEKEINIMNNEEIIIEPKEKIDYSNISLINIINNIIYKEINEKLINFKNFILSNEKNILDEVILINEGKKNLK